MSCGVALQGYRKAVVTPNAMEFSRLVKTILCKDVAPSVLPDPKLVAELSTALGHVTVVHKGQRVHDSCVNVPKCTSCLLTVASALFCPLVFSIRIRFYRSGSRFFFTIWIRIQAKTTFSQRQETKFGGNSFSTNKLGTVILLNRYLICV